MSLTKETIIDQISVDEHGSLMIREATKILDNGKEVSRTYHRLSISPGGDLTGQPTNVVAIANTVWTSEVLAKYQAMQAAIASERSTQGA